MCANPLRTGRKCYQNMILPTNTRFNPTTTGALHLGHAYLCLINEYEAHRSGGKFIVRIDDNQPEWVWRNGKGKNNEIAISFQHDLNWLGLEVDQWRNQSDMQSETDELLECLLGDNVYAGVDRFTHSELPGTPGVRYYPYTARFTLEKCVMDFINGANCLIRGIDLITEHALYLYFCDMLRLPYPRMVYLPRLEAPGGGDLHPWLSKQSGGQRILDYRNAGYTPEDVKSLLRKCCLTDPTGEWAIENVKPHPQIILPT